MKLKSFMKKLSKIDEIPQHKQSSHDNYWHDEGNEIKCYIYDIFLNIK